MSYEIKENQGSLFANENKKTDKHPDYKGKCKINGKVLNVSGWINEAKSSGRRYMSLKFDEYVSQQENTTGYTTTTTNEAEVPF